MRKLHELEWLEVNERHQRALAPEGGRYEILVGVYGVEWLYYGDGTIISELCPTVEEGKLRCEAHRRAQPHGAATEDATPAPLLASAF